MIIKLAGKPRAQISQVIKSSVHLFGADSGHPLVVQGLGLDRIVFAIFGEYLERCF